MLARRGVRRVRGVDLAPALSAAAAAAAGAMPVEYVACDLAALGSAAGRALLGGVDAVFHAASVIDLAPWPGPHMAAVNAGGTARLVAAAEAAGVRALVYTSSIDVVCDGRELVAADESTPYPARPSTGYARTKGQAERCVLAAAARGALRACALRPGHIYGPDDLMLHICVEKVAAGALPATFPHGISDYVYVDNLAHAHLQAWDALREPAGVANGQCYVRCGAPTLRGLCPRRRHLIPSPPPCSSSLLRTTRAPRGSIWRHFWPTTAWSLRPCGCRSGSCTS